MTNSRGKLLAQNVQGFDSIDYAGNCRVIHPNTRQFIQRKTKRFDTVAAINLAKSVIKAADQARAYDVAPSSTLVGLALQALDIPDFESLIAKLVADIQANKITLADAGNILRGAYPDLDSDVYNFEHHLAAATDKAGDPSAHPRPTISAPTQQANPQYQVQPEGIHPGAPKKAQATDAAHNNSAMALAINSL